MGWIDKKKGDLVTFGELEQLLSNIEVYKFKLYTIGPSNSTQTWTVNIKDHFPDINEDNIGDYEFNGMLVPFHTHQTAHWSVRYNNWWTSQSLNTSTGNITFKVNVQTAGGWRATLRTNKKWFSVVLWMKPLTNTVKRLHLPLQLLEIDDHTGELVHPGDIGSASDASTGGTLKVHRFTPSTNGYTNIRFKEWFPNYIYGPHQIGVVPSLTSMYTTENYGAPEDGSLTVNNDYNWLDVSHEGFNGSSKPVEFLMFRGLGPNS